MENSVLSDAAGVQKNISKMYEEHAQSIGKSTNALTQAEKAQAVYNGIMAEASMFTGSAAEMANGYQGQQAQLNAVNLEMSRTLGESMIPVLTQVNSILLSITKGISGFIKNHKGATGGIITFTATLLATIVALTALKKAHDAYEKSAIKSTIATKGFTMALLSNPITGIAATLATVAGIFATYKTATEEQAEAQSKLNEVTERYNQIQEGKYKYTDENIAQAQADKEVLEEQKKLLEEKIELEEKIKELNGGNTNTNGLSSIEAQNAAMSRVTQGNQEQINNMKKSVQDANNAINEYRKKLNEVEKQLEDSRKSNGNFGNSVDEINKKIDENTDFLDEANAVKNISKALDIKTIQNKQKEAAELEKNVNQMQSYLNVVKKGDKSTTEYQEAVKALAKAYPEAANAEGIIIDQAQGFIDAESLKAKEAWKGSQNTINYYIGVIQKALESETVQRQVAQNIGISWESLVPKLQNVLNILQVMASYKPEKVPGVTPTKITTPKVSKSSGSKSSKSYENKKLDNYIKLIEYKKSLDKLTLQQEIKMYQTALNKYAKTTDEKRNLRTKIYELNKELAQKEKDLLDKQTEDYEVYIQKQKNLRGSAYDLTEQTKDYDKIIAMHQKYLKKIMKDKRLSLDERKELYREELQTVRDYEQQKRDLMVEQVDNTVSQLTDAITKQLEEAQEREKEAIDKNLEEVEKWKDARIDAINEEYDARIEAIEKELEALDKAEKQKTRDEEDAEHEKKKKRLEELIAFEHDATTKANYQKELDKLLEEYQKTLDKRALDDKKEALNEQKELLKEEQNNKTQAIEDEAEKQKEIYETQLEELEKYYDEQTKKAQETAEKMLLNVQKNQNQILELLKKYGNAYEITGQSLGEKIAQGIDKGLTNKIKGIIQKIQDTIDANIEAKVKEWTRSNYKYESSANKPKQTNINITQQNYIEQNPEMPSETYRKLKNVSEKLAEEIEGL